MSDELSPDDIPLPGYNHHRVTSAREKISAALASHTEVLTENAFKSFVGAVKSCLPYIVTLQTVQDSLIGYLGKKLSLGDRQEIACRLSGNIDELCMQRTVLSHSKPVAPEWALSCVESVHVVRSSNGNLVNRLVFKILTGAYAGRDIVSNWSFKRFNYSAVVTNEKGIGFGLTRPRLNRDGEDLSRYTYKDYRQLIGFECYLLVDPRRCGDYPTYVAIGHNSGTQNHNRKLLLSRLRANSPCILSEKVQHNCYACPVGKSECPRAVRRLSCYRGTCKVCRVAGLIDPSEAAFRDMCTKCADIERKRKK